MLCVQQSMHVHQSISCMLLLELYATAEHTRHTLLYLLLLSYSP